MKPFMSAIFDPPSSARCGQASQKQLAARSSRGSQDKQERAAKSSSQEIRSRQMQPGAARRSTHPFRSCSVIDTPYRRDKKHKDTQDMQDIWHKRYNVYVSGVRSEIHKIQKAQESII